MCVCVLGKDQYRGVREDVWYASICMSVYRSMLEYQSVQKSESARE